MIDLAEAVREWGRRAERAAARGRFGAMAAALRADPDLLPERTRAKAIAKCVACPNKAACRKWLRSGVWQGTEVFCPNWDLLFTMYRRRFG